MFGPAEWVPPRDPSLPPIIGWRAKWHRALDLIEAAQRIYAEHPYHLNELAFLIRNVLYDITNTNDFSQGVSYSAQELKASERVRDHVLGRTYAARRILMGPFSAAELDGRSMRGWIEDAIYDYCYTRDVTKEEHASITARGNSADAYYDVPGPWNA